MKSSSPCSGHLPHTICGLGLWQSWSLELTACRKQQSCPSGWLWRQQPVKPGVPAECQVFGGKKQRERGKEQGTKDRKGKGRNTKSLTHLLTGSLHPLVQYNPKFPLLITENSSGLWRENGTRAGKSLIGPVKNEFHHFQKRKSIRKYWYTYNKKKP